MKKNVPTIFALAVATLVTTGIANAQDGQDEGCYASSVVLFEQESQTNGNPVAEDRSNPELALGLPDASNAAGGFVSLGDGGSITLGFDGVVYDLPGNDLKIYETSFSGDNCGLGDDESALIEVSLNGEDFYSLGTICRDGEVDIALSELAYITQIRITSVAGTTFDGYDVDGVEALNGCAPMPVEEEGCYGGEVLSFIPGPKNNDEPITDPNRIDPTQASGAPQLDDTFNFVSLGYGGVLVLGFDGGVAFNGPGDDILVAETTFGNNDFASFPESADVLVSQDGTTFFFIGSLSTSEVATFDIDEAGQGFAYVVAVKIVDTTPEGSISEDAFDVDGVEALNGCGPIPVTEGGECYAAEIKEYVQGTRSNGGAISANRTDEEQALGEPEGTDQLVFVTLGYGGSITLGFNGSVLNEEGDDLEIVETSFNTVGCEAYKEYARVYVSVDGLEYHYAKTVCKSDNLVDISDAGNFDFINYVKIVNDDVLTLTPDAYDLDGVRAIHNCLEEEEGDDENEPALAESTEEAAQLSVYPNPAIDQLYIEFTPITTERVTVELFDLNGRSVATIYNQEVQAGSDYRIDFNGASLPNGVYITKFISSNEIVTKKVMIAR